jgi:hypothetical protein
MSTTASAGPAEEIALIQQQQFAAAAKNDADGFVVPFADDAVVTPLWTIVMLSLCGLRLGLEVVRNAILTSLEGAHRLVTVRAPRRGPTVRCLLSQYRQ